MGAVFQLSCSCSCCDTLLTHASPLQASGRRAGLGGWSSCRETGWGLSWEAITLRLWTCAWRLPAWPGMLALKALSELTSTGPHRAPCRSVLSLSSPSSASCQSQNQSHQSEWRPDQHWASQGHHAGLSLRFYHHCCHYVMISNSTWELTSTGPPRAPCTCCAF